ncbi:MAG: ankyrin repeat domain-containing protein [Puniceicoccales bacterium]|jgi:hypothetical protein|nr:ankyrin repeat domain-containing protein [Puniceicoccales bacterium]
MEKKSNLWIGKSAWIVSLTLGCSHLTLEASLPCFSTWNDRTKLDSCIALGATIASIDKLEAMITSFVAKGTSAVVNQKLIIGYSFPIIFPASCLKSTAALEKLLADHNTDVCVETALGNTPMHAAAINSGECLKLLINDGRLDINEHNNEGETPLYKAIEFDNAVAIEAIINADRFKVNSRDNLGRTMIHIAVIKCNKRVLNCCSDPDFKAKLAAINQELKVNVEDDNGKTPADYLDDIKDLDAKKIMQGRLCALGAKYSNGDPVQDPNQEA